MLQLLVGMLIGFILAIPPGPVGITVIRLSLNNSPKTSTFLALGVGLMDIFFCMSVMFASAAVIKAIGSLPPEFTFFLLIFQILIILTLIAYGIFSLKSKPTPIPQEDDLIKRKHTKFVDKLMHKGPLFFGIAIAMTNIPNPSFLPGIALIVSQAYAFGILDNNLLTNLLFAVGFGSGNFIWLSIVVHLIAKFKARMSEVMLDRIRKFAGISLIGVGTFLGFRLVSLTHWDTVLRFIFAF